MESRLQLALDAMGGDEGPKVVIPAAIQYLRENPDVELTLYGQQDELLKHLPGHDPAGIDRCRVKYSSQSVTDDESASSALRHKRDSSMWLAIKAVAESDADACISGGNTGALMAMGLALLGSHKDVDRPAICTALPTKNGGCYVLDMGANVDCAATQLQQFALMATALVKGIEGIVVPTVALLNIGKESIKGNKLVKESAQLLSGDSRINYVGFIEADELLKGEVDIVVCDGFIGNILLKASEGAARMILGELAGFATASETKGAALGNDTEQSIIRELKNTYSPAAYNGAILLGLNNVVIKSHGSADQRAYVSALGRAARSAAANIPERIAGYLEKQSR